MIKINGNHILPQTLVKGDIIRLKTSSDGHHNGESPYLKPEGASQNFADALGHALETVNDQQIHSEKLAIKLVSEPGSVQTHDVRIALEKARMSLSFTKTIADVVVRTYRELVNLR